MKRMEKMPPLIFSHSLIMDVEVNDTVGKTRRKTPAEINRREITFWRKSDCPTRYNLPPISNKQLNTIRRRTWNVMPTLNWRENVLDAKSLYSSRQDELLDTIVAEHKLLPPLESSQRMDDHVPDTQNLLEKVVVMKDYFSNGTESKSKVSVSRKTLPTTYNGFFGGTDTKKKHIDDQWNEYFKSKENMNGSLGNSSTNRSCGYCELTQSKNCLICRNNPNFMNVGYSKSPLLDNGTNIVKRNFRAGKTTGGGYSTDIPIIHFPAGGKK